MTVVCLSVGYGMQSLMARTFVDEVFGGMLVSTVTCDVCGSVSSDMYTSHVLM